MFGKSWNKLLGMLSGDSDNQIYDYKQMTQQTMGMNVSILSSYVMNAYRFNNLPKEIDQNLMWAMLTQYSTAVIFYNDVVDKFMFLPYVRKDEKRQNNFLFKPTLVEARDYAGKTYNVRCDGQALEGEFEGVVLHISNTSRFNVDLHYMLQYYASKMTSIDRSIDVRRNYHRAPAIFSGDEKMKSSFIKLFEDITEFKPFFVLSDMMQEGLNSMNMDYNYISDRLYAEKKQYQNEFLNLWGINNNETEKKERLITDEVNANNEQLLINRDNVLHSLNSFALEFNEKFGGNIGAVFKRETITETNEVLHDEDLFDEGNENNETNI